jgi:predicted RNA methylase
MGEPLHEVCVKPLPRWLDGPRWLGPGAWRATDLDARSVSWSATLGSEAAALLSARLRGLGLDGEPVEVVVNKPLSRASVRAGRLAEARLRRDTTKGFVQKGALLDEEARYSLTPEALALALGKLAQGLRVIDATAGAGGNAIGFARAGCRVTAIELDAERLRMAQHNAALYGVSERITFVHGDARVHVPTLDADLLFIDPPWARDYDKRRTTLEALPLLEALLTFGARFARTWAKVPASFVTSEVQGAEVIPFFGVAEGDAQRIKFLLLRMGRLR